MGVSATWSRFAGKLVASVGLASCLALFGATTVPAMAVADEELAAGSSDLLTAQSQGEYTAAFAFSDDSVQVTQAGDTSTYKVSGTTLAIKASGTYYITGSCSNGSIEVAKGLTGVTLCLGDLSLTSTDTAPVVVKKGSTVTVQVEGNVTLADAEDPANETSDDAEVADAFEGACVKVKSGSSVTFTGSGTLNVDGSVCKNGIKGASTAALVFNMTDGTTDGTVNVQAANNGIASDGSVAISAGTYVISAANDGIKSVPEADDADSAGSVTITGGTFDIDVDGDGIQADALLSISDGVFDIKTLGGYDDASFDKDTMSCKGLKASGDREDIENTVSVTGGSFALNCADDAVHSDVYATVTGGTFSIYTGDDGMHADTSLILGSEGGLERDPDVMVHACYEGLEGGTVYVYSGRFYVVASDDGINAADGSGSGTAGAGGGQDPFNPGGGGPGGWGGRPMSAASASDDAAAQDADGLAAAATSDFNIYIYGGDVYVNCTGDGLDSNGGLYLYGGTQTVLSQGTGGDNSPLDWEGTAVIDGATVFAAGTRGVDGTLSAGNFKQNYVQQNVSASTGTIVAVSQNGTLLHNEKLLRNVNYIMYSAPSSALMATPSLSAASSLDACKSNSWAHSWNDGAITTSPTADANGVRTFTCSACGETERQTVTALTAQATANVADGNDAVPATSNSGTSNGERPGGNWNSGAPGQAGGSVSNSSATTLPSLPSGAAETTSWKRLWGQDALGTMTAIVDEAFSSSDTVVIATLSGYWDALAASSLAGAFDAPVLITDGASLSSEALAEVTRLGATKAFICGGTAAISQTAEDQLRQAGCSTERLGGSDAQDTAVLIAGAVGESRSNTCIVATSGTFQDALSIAPYAYAANAPIFLTNGDGTALADGTRAAIADGGYTNVIVVGGTAAVSTDVADQLGAMGLSVTRLAGATAYETSTAIASWELKNGLSATVAAVATGEDYYDALTGAALCGSRNGVLVLVSDANRTCIDSFLAPNASAITDAYVFGGPAAVSDASMTALQS